MNTQFALLGPVAKFCLGKIVTTPNALARIPHDDMLHSLGRHVQGDWGELESEDMQSNECALKAGGRLFSQYRSAQDIKFWIITEADRSITTVLLPEDY